MAYTEQNAVLRRVFYPFNVLSLPKVRILTKEAIRTAGFGRGLVLFKKRTVPKLGYYKITVLGIVIFNQRISPPLKLTAMIFL